MEHQKWFWRGVVGLIAAVMIMAVSHVSQFLTGEYLGAGIITVNTFEKAFVPEAGETILTTTVDLRDNDGRSAFQNSASGAFAARVGDANALLGGSIPMQTAPITNLNGEVLRYVVEPSNVIGTFYLGVTENLATETFTALAVGGGDSANDVASDGNNVVYVLINTPAIQPYIQKYRVDFSTGSLIFDNVSGNVVGQDLNLFGKILFQNGRLYYADSFDFYEVTESGGAFVFTDVGLAQDFGKLIGIADLQGVVTGGGAEYFLIRGSIIDDEVIVVERTAGGVYSIIDMNGAAPGFSFDPPGGSDYNDISLTLETFGAGTGNPLLVYVGAGNAICGRDVTTLTDTCNNNAAAVSWVDTGRDPGTVLFEAGGVVNITNRIAGPDYSDGPFGVFSAASYADFSRDFGITFTNIPTWNQQALNTSGRIDTNPLFVGDGFRDVTIIGNLISENPVVMDIFWGQNGGAFPGIPDATVVAPGTFNVPLSGTHVDSRLGDSFRFDFPAGNEFLISDIQITASINTDSAFVFNNCYVQDGLGNTPVEVTVIDVEGDVGAVAVDGNPAICAGNICTADVPAIPEGSYPLSFAVTATDLRGNVSNGTSQTGILVLGNGKTCGGGRRVVGPLGNNHPPVIVVGAPDPLEVYSGEKVKFDISGIDEDEGNTLRLFFLGDPTRQFADGYRAAFKPLQTDAQVVKSSFEWQTQVGAEGSYDFTFEVVDNTSLRSEKTFTIDVVPMPPPEAPEYEVTLDVSSIEDQHLGIVSLSSTVSSLKGLEQVPRNFAQEDYPVVFERCIRATGVNYSETIRCDEVVQTDPSAPIDLSKIEAFSETYYLPTTVRTFAFQSHLKISSQNNADTNSFLFEASSPFVIWTPEMVITDSLGNDVQSPINLTSLDELLVSSRWRDIQFTLDGRRARNRVERVSEDISVFTPVSDVSEGQEVYEWSVPLGIEGDLCISLFQDSECFELFLPEDKKDDPVPLPVPQPPQPPQEQNILPEQYIYPSHRIRINDDTEQVVSVFATVDPYRGDELLAVDPQILDIRFIPIGFELGDVEVRRTASGYPSVSVIVPRGVMLDVEFFARFDEGPYVYHRERLEPSDAREIIRGTDEVTPLLRQVQEDDPDAPQVQEDGLLQVSDTISLKVPTTKFSPSGLTLHGVTQENTLKICLLDMQTGQIIEGNTIDVNPNGSFYGAMANEKLPQGNYTSVPFADIQTPCTQLMQSWFLLEDKDPHPFVLEVTDDLFSISVLQYAWSGTSKTAIDPLDFRAYDLTGENDFLVDIDIKSPYEYRSELYVEILNSGFARAVPLEPKGSRRLSVHIPGLNYGIHTMLIYAVLETGEKTPDVVIPFEYTEQGAIALHGAAPEVSWLWIVLVLVVVLMVVLWKMGGAEDSSSLEELPIDLDGEGLDKIEMTDENEGQDHEQLSNDHLSNDKSETRDDSV